jgi:hypothetical protein
MHHLSHFHRWAFYSKDNLLPPQAAKVFALFSYSWVGIDEKLFVVFRTYRTGIPYTEVLLKRWALMGNVSNKTQRSVSQLVKVDVNCPLLPDPVVSPSVDRYYA